MQYFFFGRSQRRERIIGRKSYDRLLKKPMAEYLAQDCSEVQYEYSRLIQLFQHTNQAFPFEGNRVAVYTEGYTKLQSLLRELQKAKQHIHMEYYIFEDDAIGRMVRDVLIEKAMQGHDFCVISLSDLMTPWERIERRIRAAAMADFVTAVYNPKSEGRYWQLYRLKELFLAEGRAPETPVGYVRQAGREEQEVHLTTLADFNPEEVDMFTVILIGNSQSYAWNGKFITPRGYYNRPDKDEQPTKGIGQDIMIQSFRTIESELKNKNIPLDHKWALLHAIHTTADFEMEKLLYTDKGAVEKLYQKIADGRLKTIVTDVTMAASGIRKGALQRLGVEVKCYLSDERVAAMAAEKGITRTQAGIRLAVEEHPDALFVFGNAPTALMELCDLVRKGKAVPSGIIAAPVGFVHVQESKHMVKPFMEIPKLIVEGRKGGSNLAATLVNAILCYNDAEQLRPGRDV